jgi:hypothetical protein
MLVNEPYVLNPSPILQMIAAVNGNRPGSEEVRPGVYLVGHFGSSRFPCPGYESYPEFGRAPDNTYRSAYGVCDSIEQVLTLFPELEAPGREFIVTLTEVRRDVQGSTGGWRWHKWGPYIGSHTPLFEYLYDESIERVFVYHIYEKLS